MSHLLHHLICEAKVSLANSGLVFPGEVLSGHVDLTIHRGHASVQELSVEFHGAEHVIVVENLGGTANVVNDQTPFLSDVLTLVGPPDEQPSQPTPVVLQQGTYTYPFSFSVPPTPPSIEKWSDNHMSYGVTAIFKLIDPPSEVKDTAIVDIGCAVPRAQWDAATPFELQKGYQMKYCCGFLSGSVMAGVYVDRTVLLIGDAGNEAVAKFDVMVDNSRGKEPVKAVEANLMLHTHTWVRDYSDGAHISKAKFEHAGAIPVGASGSFSGHIQIPKDSPPSYKGTHMAVRYFLRVELDIPWATDPILLVPLLVAHRIEDSGPVLELTTERCVYSMIKVPPRRYYPTAVEDEGPAATPSQTEPFRTAS